jgi:hypothetical protein
LEDAATTITAVDTAVPGQKALITAWKGQEDLYKIACLASLVTGVIGVVGVVAGIVLPREGILDLLYTIWMFVVAATFASVGAATFAQSAIIKSRLDINNLVITTPSGNFKAHTISSIRSVIYKRDYEYAARLGQLVNAAGTIVVDYRTLDLASYIFIMTAQKILTNFKNKNETYYLNIGFGRMRFSCQHL